eukprot:183787-Chlamydomonas_euryale.AAC.2
MEQQTPQKRHSAPRNSRLLKSGTQRHATADTLKAALSTSQQHSSKAALSATDHHVPGKRCSASTAMHSCAPTHLYLCPFSSPISPILHHFPHFPPFPPFSTISPISPISTFFLMQCAAFTKDIAQPPPPEYTISPIFIFPFRPASPTSSSCSVSLSQETMHSRLSPTFPHFHPIPAMCRFHERRTRCCSPVPSAPTSTPLASSPTAGCGLRCGQCSWRAWSRCVDGVNGSDDMDSYAACVADACLQAEDAVC